jgi:hypothetical protein
MPDIRRLLRLIVFASLLAFPVPALAAQTTFYAAPTPVGTTDCSSAADACSLTTALGDATTAGDQVLLESGTYGAPSTPLSVTSSGAAITIAPDVGAGRPVIDFSSDGSENPNLVLSGNVSLTGVDIVGDANARYMIEADTGALIDRVSVISNYVATPANQAIAVNLESGAILRNSMVTQNSASSTTLNAAPSAAVASEPEASGAAVSLLNDSIVAPGSGSAAVSLDPLGAAANATIINTIMRGSGKDIYANPNGGDAVTATVTNADYNPANSTPNGTVDSNTTTITATGTVTGAPLFTDEATGDLHEAAGSPTIDAGTSDPGAGAFAFDGQARTIGPATDIGADETENPSTPPPTVTPPTVGTAIAFATSDTTASVSAPVTPNGSATTTVAQFGTTTGYGSFSAAQSAGSGSAAVDQTLTLTGLQPSTIYDVRIVAANGGGSTPSANTVFATPAAPAVDAISTCTSSGLTLTCTNSGGKVTCTVATSGASKTGAGAGKDTATCKGDTLAVGCTPESGGVIFCGGLVTGANFTCTPRGTKLSCVGPKTGLTCASATKKNSQTCKFNAGAPLPSLGTPLKLSSRVLHVGALGSTTVPVLCPAASTGVCKGDLQLAVPWPGGSSTVTGSTTSKTITQSVLGSSSVYSSKPGTSTGGPLTSPLKVVEALIASEHAKKLPLHGAPADVLTGGSLNGLVRALGGSTRGVRVGAAGWVIALAPGTTAAALRKVLAGIVAARHPSGHPAQPVPTDLLQALGFVEVVLVAKPDISKPSKAIAPVSGLGWTTI